MSMLYPNDVKQELSFLYMHSLATKEGHSFERRVIDKDSVDASIFARGRMTELSILHSPQLDIQLKATNIVQEKSSDFINFELPVKNFRDLSSKSAVPRVLILVTLPQVSENQCIEWTEESILIKGKAYWMSLSGLPKCDNIKSKSIMIPKKNVMNHASLTNLLITISKCEVIENE